MTAAAPDLQVTAPRHVVNCVLRARNCLQATSKSCDSTGSRVYRNDRSTVRIVSPSYPSASIRFGTEDTFAFESNNNETVSFNRPTRKHTSDQFDLRR